MEKIDENRLEETARLLKVLGHPMRLAMVETLSERPWCVCELADSLGLNKSAASKHLSLLKGVGVIEMEREGTQVKCDLVKSCVLDLIHCIDLGVTSVKIHPTINKAEKSSVSEGPRTCCPTSRRNPK